MNVAIHRRRRRGTRMGGGGRAPKQFLEIAGTPSSPHARRFEACATIAEVVVVVPLSEVQAFLELAENSVEKLARRRGWRTRTESVWRGSGTCAQRTGRRAVHDGVRPFVTPEEIDRTVEEARTVGAAVLATRAVDTIKEGGGDGLVARTLERSRLWHAQTPQCFRHDLLRRAYESARADGFEATDDSSLVERLGVPVQIVEGGAHNIKITTPQDLALAEMIVQSSKFKV